jgi:uncharacterized coiled-coil protein SlyX
LAIGFAMMLWPAGVGAEEQVGRFVLKDGGQGVYLRLDTETGAISQCSHAAQVWACTSVSDDRAELHKEIARLEEENEALTERLNRLANNKAPDQKLTLPSDADIDRVLAVFQKFFDRILSFIRSLEQKQADQGV